MLLKQAQEFEDTVITVTSTPQTKSNKGRVGAGVSNTAKSGKGSSNMPSAFLDALRQKLTTAQPHPPAVQPTVPTDQLSERQVTLERYKKLEVLLREARSKDSTAFLHNPHPMPVKLGTAQDKHDSHRLWQAAKQITWERMAINLLSQEEMMTFYSVLEKWAERVPQGLDPKFFRSIESGLRERGLLAYDKYIDLDSFFRARTEMHPRIREWLRMAQVMTFMKDSDDYVFRRVPIIHLFNYVMKKVWLTQTRLGFMNYDLEGGGYLKEDWLESYIKELIPSLKQLEGIDPGLLPFYLCAATRRFFFFLDPKRIGKIRIVSVLSSMLLDDILELRDTEVKDSNWFSKYSLLGVYQHYLQLDQNSNGMLSQLEFIKFNYSSHGDTIRLTPAFVTALFSEKMTYQGEMDFRSYVDFILAMENKKEKQSISYFVRVLDLNKKGYINAWDLHHFYKDVFQILIEFNPETPKFDDVKDEIFDMVKPADPLKITVKDLCKCGKGDVVINMLIDAKGFDNFENREFVVNQSPSPSTPQLRQRHSLSPQ